jgi:hypothetical protein
MYFSDKQKHSLPHSARVKAVISVSQNDAKEKLSAVLFAVPGEKYRFELSGSFGLSAASILWEKEGWRIVFSQAERYMEGTGDCVFLPVYGGVDIHKFALLFFGQRVDSVDCENPEQNLILEYRDNSAYAVLGSDSLKLEIKDIEPKSSWKSGTWNLNVPEKYIRSDW